MRETVEEVRKTNAHRRTYPAVLVIEQVNDLPNFPHMVRDPAAIAGVTRRI
jgi:hypothetical protein